MLVGNVICVNLLAQCVIEGHCIYIEWLLYKRLISDRVILIFLIVIEVIDWDATVYEFEGVV